MPEEITFFATLLSVYGVCIIGILIFRSQAPKALRPALYLFIISLICYLLIEEMAAGIWFELQITLTFLLPFSFWKLSRAIFSDNVQSSLRLLVEAAIVAGFYHLLRSFQGHEQWSDYGLLLMKLTSITFLILSVVESQRGKKDDLIKSRIRLRNVFVYFVTLLGLITVLTETSFAATDMRILKMSQRLSILLFTSYFLVVNSQWRDNFLGKKAKSALVLNQALINCINELLADQKYFKTEGLTIGQLAEKLGEQEYKLRSVINQEMGYRNFPAFINAFRIEEAKALLKIKGQESLTIQEVAYEVGFNSIGPFNRSFKAATGITPKVYREENASKS